MKTRWMFGLASIALLGLALLMGSERRTESALAQLPVGVDVGARDG
jgi:hypothetical protein